MHPSRARSAWVRHIQPRLPATSRRASSSSTVRRRQGKGKLDDLLWLLAHGCPAARRAEFSQLLAELVPAKPMRRWVCACRLPAAACRATFAAGAMSGRPCCGTGRRLLQHLRSSNSRRAGARGRRVAGAAELAPQRELIDQTTNGCGSRPRPIYSGWSWCRSTTVEPFNDFGQQQDG